MDDLRGTRVRQVAVVCGDVARATSFYRDQLGLPFLFSAGPQLSFFEAGGTRLMLSPAVGEARGSSTLYFSVENIEKVAPSLARRGVHFLNDAHIVARMPDHDFWLAEFKDSEGNLLALTEERPVERRVGKQSGRAHAEAV